MSTYGADCRVLVEKVVTRVRSLRARKLSYAGRLTLINSVLNTLHCYWASIFLIPKNVIHRIVAICRNFLWDGDTEYHRVPLVAWDRVCMAKDEGGLNIKHPVMWNIAMVGKLVDWLHLKADRLWVMWIDHVYLKGCRWDDYIPPTNVNWNWRNVCRVKDMLKGGYVDGWWSHSPQGYTVKSGYRWLRGELPKVQWYKQIWDAWNVPKHAFIGWLIQQQALNTRDHLYRIGVCSSNKCVLCEDAVETHEHLFFRCVYSRKLHGEIQRGMELIGDGCLLQKVRLCQVIVLCLKYSIWEERNHCRLELELRRPQVIVSRIKQLIRSRVRVIKEEWLRDQNVMWIEVFEQWCYS